MRIFMHKRERFQTCYEKQIRATGSKGEKRAGKMGNGYENLQDMGKEEMRRTVSEAVRNREYQVWYQPQVDMGTGEIFGAEALVRWRHPQKGLLLPGHFIPALEKNGLMPLLDREVLFACARKKVPVLTEEIRTIYIDHNAGSHFRPVRDSLQVLAAFLRGGKQ